MHAWGGGGDRQRERGRERKQQTDWLNHRKKEVGGGKQKLDRTERKRNKSASELL